MRAANTEKWDFHCEEDLKCSAKAYPEFSQLHAQLDALHGEKI